MYAIRSYYELLAAFGFKEDPQGNAAARFGHGGLITTADSPKAFVIPTNEELVIAQGAARWAPGKSVQAPSRDQQPAAALASA